MFVAVLTTFLIPSFSLAIQEKNSSLTLTPSQVAQIKNIVDEHLLENPEILLKAGKKLQNLEEKHRLQKITENITKYKTQIFNPKAPGRVTLGNPHGKIIVAVFTQHPCSHCKSVVPTINKLLKDNKEIQLITIYWPFLGNDAIHMAKAVLAAQNQNKREELENKLFSHEGMLTKDTAEMIIKSISSLDNKKLHGDIAAEELRDALNANSKLALDLNLIGTPTFIFTNRALTKFSLVPGKTASFEQDLAAALKTVE